MSITQRIIEIVENKEHGNMSNFARKINVTPAYISKLKKCPEAMPSDRTIRDICNVYGVNETWLRTGEGDMFAPKTWEQEVAEITATIYKDDNEFRRNLISIIAALDDDQIDLLQQIADRWISQNKKS